MRMLRLRFALVLGALLCVASAWGASPLAGGRFGSALDARAGALEIACDEAFARWPLTVECWSCLRSRQEWNILVANQPKSSADHWEIYTYAGSGRYSAYLPGYEPAENISDVDVTDGKWHHLAMTFDGKRLGLYVDGRRVLDRELTKKGSGAPHAGPLMIGSVPASRELGCDGRIDEVRISRGILALDAAPAAELRVEPATVALWKMDAADEKGVRDAVAKRLASWAQAAAPPQLAQSEGAVAQIPRPAFGVKTQSVESDWQDQYDLLAQQIADRGKLPPHIAAQVFDPQSLIAPADRDPLDVVLRRSAALLADLQPAMGERAVAFGIRLGDINQRAAAADAAGRRALYREACSLRRQIALANPLLDFDAILFVARGVYHGSGRPGDNGDAWGQHQTTQYFAFNSVPGGGLYAVKNWKSCPQVVDLLAEATVQDGPLKGQKLQGGTFMSPDLSFDGRSVAFAYTQNARHEWAWSPQTVWHLFRIGADGKGLTQLSDGRWNDFDPCFLPDGRIAFISERRGGFIRCFTEGSGLRVPTYVLHSMNPDGSGITPLSYFETSEWHPSVNSDGMIVYTRWDYVDREDCLGSTFWQCYPDGRDPRSPHGNYPRPYHTFPDNREANTRSSRPMTELNIRAIPGSQKYVLTAAPHHGEAFGSLCVLDPRAADDGAMSQLRRLTPYALFPETETPGRQFDTQQYGTAWPLSESYFLCNYRENLYLLDRFGNQELVLARSQVAGAGAGDRRFRLMDPIPLRARPAPPVIPARTRETGPKDLPRATVSVLNVYDSDLPMPKEVKIRWLRIVQVILKSNPWMDVPRIGYGEENTPRIPLGVVPVEADGSAHFEAPVGRELIFQALDERFMAVQSMRSVTYVHPGEQLTCVGCHERPGRSPKTEGLPLALRRAPSKIQPEVGGVQPVTYHRLVKNVFEENCVSCHRKEGKGPADMSYPALREQAFHFAGGFLGHFTDPIHGGSRTIPGRFGARASKIGQALLSESHRGKVSEEQFRRVVLWLDCNSPELGAFENVEAQRRGELVWPALDVDPQNPTGVEKEGSWLGAAR